MRGGAREGAGAKSKPPALKKNPISVKLPQWLIEWMNEQSESRAVLIEEAMIKKYQLKPPKPDDE